MSAGLKIALAQDSPGHVTLQPETDDFTLVLGEEPWRYHAGDNPAWADPELDDTDWMLLQPDFNPDSLAEGVWTGIGWFRIRLQVDESLRNTTLALHIFHLGASEIYLDGEKIGGFGTIGKTATEEERFSPKGVPIGLHLDQRNEHLLAVRYAFMSRNTVFAPGLGTHPRHPQGFYMLLKPVNRGIHAFIFRTLETPFTLGIIIGISLLLGGLHLLLFAFDRKEMGNLYFSLFAICGAYAIWTIAAWDAPALIIPDIQSKALPGSIARQIMLVLTIAVYHQVFYRRLLPIFWIIAGAAVLLYFLLYVMHIWFPFPNLYILVILEGLRVTIMAIWKKKDGGWILGTAIIVMFLTSRFLATIEEINRPDNRALLLVEPDAVTLTNPFALGVMVIYLSVPIAMSVLLVRRFTKTTWRLRKELNHVKELSRKTLEQEQEKKELIARQKERLEQQVHERTAELRDSIEELKSAQDQLVRQEKLASLGQLTAGIAHEIKNPLNFVNNFSDLSIELLDEAREEVKRETTDGTGKADEILAILDNIEANLSKIHEHGSRADRIVKSMLQHSRGGKGQMQPTDLNALIEEYVHLSYHGMRASNNRISVEIALDLDQELEEIVINPEEMSRVVVNLCNNAFDAMWQKKQRDEEYQPKLTVRTEGQNGQVVLEVEDNGPGIPEDIRDNVLQPFFTTKKGTEGTGLGLSITNDIVKAHGGNVDIESRNGNSTTFRITIPIKFQENENSSR